MAIVLVIVVGMAMARPSVLRTGIVSLLVPLVLALAAYVVLEPDWMGEFRFATPVWSLASIVGVLAAEAAFRQIGVRGRAVLAVAMVVALVPASKQFYDNSVSFRASPTTPMCMISERPSRVDNAYADILGIRQGSLLAPDVGATAMTSRLRIIDLAGLTDGTMANFWAHQQWPALDNYVFDVAKPTFIELHPPWSTETGLSTDPRLQRDYVLLRAQPGQPDVTDWVRKDAVTSETKLEQARAYASTTFAQDSATKFTGPLRQCGATLRPGQWPT